MKRFVYLAISVLMVLACLLFFSCDNEEAIQSLLEIVQSTDGLESMLVVVNFIEENMEEAYILEELADDSLSFTVFAPDNAAFVEFLGADGTVITETDITESWLGDVFETDAELAEALLNILGLHAIEGQELLEADLIAADSSSIGPTLYNEGTNYLNVAVDTDDVIRLTPDIGPPANPAYIETTDIEASNGVAHIVDGVMYSNIAAI
jgi:uncharacterized surface protein with fasciclin (FAS1) repeats